MATLSSTTVTGSGDTSSASWSGGSGTLFVQGDPLGDGEKVKLQFQEDGSTWTDVNDGGDVSIEGNETAASFFMGPTTLRATVIRKADSTASTKVSISDAF